mgnify:CR=1 FL=1
MSSPLSKLPPRFQAPVRAAFQALTAPADLSDEAVTATQELQPGERDVLKDRMRKPIVIGGVIMLVFIVIAGIWASFTQIEGAVSAPGLVRSEFNRRTIRQRDAGTIAALNVHEGDRVKQGQVLITFTPTQPQASVDVMRNQSDSERVQSARFEAEMLGKPAKNVPAAGLERIRLGQPYEYEDSAGYIHLLQPIQVHKDIPPWSVDLSFPKSVATASARVRAGSSTR